MGMSFDAYLLSVQKIKENVEKKKTTGDIEKLEEILKQFGEVQGDNFLLMNCEYWDEYNSYFQLMDFLDRYYGLGDSGYETVTENTKLMSVSNGQNSDEAASELEITLPEKEE